MAQQRRPSLNFEVLTLFPSLFHGPVNESILGRAQKAGILSIKIHSLRRWSEDRKHFKVDDRPFGGGAGMVIQPEPVYKAVKALGGLRISRGKPWVIYLSPQGKVLNQNKVRDLAKKKSIILICGHYEGVDERVMSLADEEISIGDYVLTGGEIPAMVLMDAVARLVPGVVGDPESVVQESFSKNLLDYPHYTRPALWRGLKVPRILLSGDHDKIRKWRESEARKRTKKRRPDLLKEGSHE